MSSYSKKKKRKEQYLIILLLLYCQRFDGHSILSSRNVRHRCWRHGIFSFLQRIKLNTKQNGSSLCKRFDSCSKQTEKDFQRSHALNKSHCIQAPSFLTLLFRRATDIIIESWVPSLLCSLVTLNRKLRSSSWNKEVTFGEVKGVRAKKIDKSLIDCSSVEGFNAMKNIRNQNIAIYEKKRSQQYLPESSVGERRLRRKTQLEVTWITGWDKV